jgi:hypothetical protein
LFLVFFFLQSRDGTFLKQCFDTGNAVAVAGGPPFLTSDFLNIDYSTNTYGVLDYECGVSFDGSPIVQPTASSSCNSNYRYAVPFRLYNLFGDIPTVDYALSIIQQGCANVVAVHLKDPDTAMHTYGLSSTQYLQALRDTDARIGSLVGAVQAHSNVYETDWLIALTSDHGGIETDKAPYVYNVNTNSVQRMDHDMNWGPDEAVPYIVNHISSSNGNISLSNFTQTPHNFDITPTILSYLGIESKDRYDGVVQGLRVPEQASNAHRVVQCTLLVIALMFLTI